MKLLLKILGALVALLLIAVVALLLFFDPNVLKPRIEALARDQGVALRIDGDLGWRLWPNLGVDVHGISVAALAEPDAPIAQLERASLLLALRPLLRREVQVHHVIVEGARIDLVIDAEGTGNWEALLTEQDAAELPEPEAPIEADTELDLTLAVERISLRDSALRYRDLRSGQDFSLRDLGFVLTGFNLQGDAFDMNLTWLAELTDPELFGGQTLAVNGDLRSRVQLAADFDSLEISQGDLSLALNRAQQTSRVRALFALQATDLEQAPAYRVTLDVPPFNARQLLAVLDLPELETAEAYALTQVGVNLTLVGDSQQVRVEPLTLVLDQTRISGALALLDLETPVVRASFAGDRLNVDHYLPPPSDEELAPEPEATGDEILIPLELIRPLDIEFALDFDQLTLVALPLRDLRVRLTADDGVVNLSRVAASLYEGQIAASANLDARTDTAIIRFDAGVQGMQLAPLMRDMELDEMLGLSGAINALAEGGTRGVTMNQLMADLKAEANFSGAQVRVSPINVEQLICQAINTVSRVEQPQRAWAEYTEMRQLAGKVVVNGPEIRLESFDAGVQQLALAMRGTLNLDSSAYDFTLPLRLLSSTTGEHGCTVSSNYWIDRSLSLLRCRGTLSELNPLSDCRPDARGLESLVKDFANYQLRARHGDQIDAAEQRLQQTRQEAEQRADAARQELEAREAELRREAEAREEELRRQAEEKRREEQRALEERLRDRLRR